MSDSKEQVSKRDYLKNPAAKPQLGGAGKTSPSPKLPRPTPQTPLHHADRYGILI